MLSPEGSQCLSLKFSANADVCKGMKNVHFQVSPKLQAQREKKKEKEKKVVHSPFSALALQMLMKSVLSWALNRSKMLRFGTICIPS